MILRAWVSFAAIGTGLIHLAMVLSAPLWLAIPLTVLGMVEFGWGVLTFASDPPLVPLAAIVVAIVPVLAWITLLTMAGSIPEIANPSTLVPLGIASVFELFVAAVLGRQLQRPRPTPAPKPSTPRYVIGIAAGALVTAALVTPALAAAQAPAFEGAELEQPTHHGP